MRKLDDYALNTSSLKWRPKKKSTLNARVEHYFYPWFIPLHMHVKNDAGPCKYFGTTEGPIVWANERKICSSVLLFPSVPLRQFTFITQTQ